MVPGDSREGFGRLSREEGSSATDRQKEPRRSSVPMTREGMINMRMKQASRVVRFLLPIGGAVLLGGSAYAFMATNSVPISGAGQGANTISGYTVTNIHYTLGPQGQHIKTVGFSLTPMLAGAGAATSAYAWFGPAGGGPAPGGPAGGNYTCSEVSASGLVTTWNCSATGSGVPVQPAVMLNVSAAQ